jgi:hypothetical protein
MLVGASFNSIELSQAAADAALKSLDLVSDSYVTGAVSITELLDAQAAAFDGGRALHVELWLFPDRQGKGSFLSGYS